MAQKRPCGFNLDKKECTTDPLYDGEYDYICNYTSGKCDKPLNKSMSLAQSYKIVLENNPYAHEMQRHNIRRRSAGKPLLYNGKPLPEQRDNYKPSIDETPVPVPKEKTPVPREKTPVPREKTPVPKEKTPVPVPREKTPVPVPKEKTPVPVPREKTPVPVPREKTPVPREKTPVPVPVPKEKTPVPREKTPVPVPKEKTPVPVPKEKTPVPVPKEKTPVPREKTPTPPVLDDEDIESVVSSSTSESVDEFDSPPGSVSSNNASDSSVENISKKIEKLDLPSTKTCSDKNYFRNEYNSCYIDSLLFALLHVPNNNFVKHLKFEMQRKSHKLDKCENDVINNVIGLHDSIHYGSAHRINPEMFRRVIRDCIRKIIHSSISSSEPIDKFFREEKYNPDGKLKPEYSINNPSMRYRDYYIEDSNRTFMRTQQDVNEHLAILFDLVRVSDVATTNSIMILSNGRFPPVTSQIEKIRNSVKLDQFTKNKGLSKVSPIYVLDLMSDVTLHTENMIFTISDISELDDENSVRVTCNEIGKCDDKTVVALYNHKINKTQYLDTPFLAIRVNRCGYDSNGMPTKHKHKIQWHDTMKTEKNGILSLSSIVVHHGNSCNGGHYVCIFKCADYWYVMDDTSNNLVQLGRTPYNDTIRTYTREDVQRNCTTLFYF